MARAAIGRPNLRAMNQASGIGAVMAKLGLGALKPSRTASFSTNGRNVIRQMKLVSDASTPAWENSWMPWPAVSDSEANETSVVSMVSALAGPTTRTVSSTAL